MSTQPTISAPASSASKHAFTTKELVLGGMFAAVLAVISQLSIPMPTGVPITIQVFGVALVGVVLGWRLGLLATLTYILLGAVGLPVFANFTGGFHRLAGVTGGYIWAWPFMTALSGIQPKTGSKYVNMALIIVSSLLGLAIVEIIGGLQWAMLAGDQTIAAVFAYSMVAFVPKDIVITILAVVIGIPMRKTIFRQR
ncbi:MAG: biotin transporter BioY [Lachnospiraceae bacterium]|nr:biotin transporter BioY [Lachnospiraceae bacterium]